MVTIVYHVAISLIDDINGSMTFSFYDIDKVMQEVIVCNGDYSIISQAVCVKVVTCELFNHGPF